MQTLNPKPWSVLQPGMSQESNTAQPGRQKLAMQTNGHGVDLALNLLAVMELRKGQTPVRGWAQHVYELTSLPRRPTAGASTWR